MTNLSMVQLSSYNSWTICFWYPLGGTCQFTHHVFVCIGFAVMPWPKIRWCKCSISFWLYIHLGLFGIQVMLLQNMQHCANEINDHSICVCLSILDLQEAHDLKLDARNTQTSIWLYTHMNYLSWKQWFFKICKTMCNWDKWSLEEALYTKVPTKKNNTKCYK